GCLLFGFEAVHPCTVPNSGRGYAGIERSRPQESLPSRGIRTYGIGVAQGSGGFTNPPAARAPSSSVRMVHARSPRPGCIVTILDQQPLSTATTKSAYSVIVEERHRHPALCLRARS